MLSYIIEGGRRLEGTLDVSGSKNASLPIIAASILSGRTQNSRRLNETNEVICCTGRSNNWKV